MKKNNKRFKISKWIMLSIAVSLNIFIIFYSCLDNQTTIDWNRSLTNFFTNLVNGFSNNEKEIIKLTKIDARFSTEVEHGYNYLPGYKTEEIPLGSAKEIRCDFSPNDATDKSVTYTANPLDLVALNQSGSTFVSCWNEGWRMCHHGKKQ